MARRKEHYPFLLPSNALSVELSLDSTHKLSDFAYFDRHLVINTLKMSGYDTSAIDIPYNPSPIPGSWVFVIVFLVISCQRNYTSRNRTFSDLFATGQNIIFLYFIPHIHVKFHFEVYFGD